MNPGYCCNNRNTCRVTSSKSTSVSSAERRKKTNMLMFYLFPGKVLLLYESVFIHVVFISQQFPLSSKVQCFNPINFPLASGFWLLPHERRHVGSPLVILMRCWALCTMKGQSKEPSQACMGGCVNALLGLRNPLEVSNQSLPWTSTERGSN